MERRYKYELIYPIRLFCSLDHGAIDTFTHAPCVYITFRMRLPSSLPSRGLEYLVPPQIGSSYLPLSCPSLAKGRTRFFCLPLSSLLFSSLLFQFTISFWLCPASFLCSRNRSSYRGLCQRCCQKLNACFVGAFRPWVILPRPCLWATKRTCPRETKNTPLSPPQRWANRRWAPVPSRDGLRTWLPLFMGLPSTGCDSKSTISTSTSTSPKSRNQVPSSLVQRDLGQRDPEIRRFLCEGEAPTTPTHALLPLLLPRSCHNRWLQLLPSIIPKSRQTPHRWTPCLTRLFSSENKVRL
jgi:hypothetical protein